MTLGDLVIVYWDDACGGSEWTSYEDACEALPIAATSVGWIVRDDDICLNLISSYTSEQVGDALVIPRGMVRKIIKLEDGE
jgi:hypothetical protein